MKAEESLALIAYRLERSRESLRAAEIMFENNIFDRKTHPPQNAKFKALTP